MTDDEARAAAYRESMARRQAYRARLNAQMAGDPAARARVQAAYDPLIPPFDIEVPDEQDIADPYNVIDN